MSWAGTGGSRSAAVAAGVGLAVVVGVSGAIVVTGGAQRASDDVLPPSEDVAAPEPTRDEDVAEAGRGTTTTSVYSGWADVSAADGSYTMSLPRSWTFAPFDGTPPEVAEWLLPGDPATAQVADMVGTLGTESTLGIAIDAPLWASYSTGPVLVVERYAGSDLRGFVESYRAQPPWVGQTVGTEDHLTGSHGEIVVLETTVSTESVPVNVFLLASADEIWSLTLWDHWREVGNRIALSFTPAARTADGAATPAGI